MRRLLKYGIAIAAGVILGMAGIIALGLVWVERGPQPWTERVARPLALTREEVSALQTAGELRYGWSAEINHHPSPAKVLGLKDSLALSPAQNTKVQIISREAQVEAQTIGHLIIGAEARLSVDFATGFVTEKLLRKRVDELADLYGRLRFIHLQAHLRTRKVLSQKQVERYNDLQGYHWPSQ